MMNYSNSFGWYTVGKVRHRLFCGEGIKATKYSWDLSNLGQIPREIAVVIGSLCTGQERKGQLFDLHLYIPGTLVFTEYFLNE